MLLAAVQNKRCSCCLPPGCAMAICPAHAPISLWLAHGYHSAAPPTSPPLCLPLPAATEDYDFVFAENGLVAYREGKLLAVQSLRKQLGEARLKVRDSKFAHEIIQIALCWPQ